VTDAVVDEMHPSTLFTAVSGQISESVMLKVLLFSTAD